MKRTIRYMLAAMAFLAVSSCNEELTQNELPEQEGKAYTFTASVDPETKTVLDGTVSMWMGDDGGNEYIHVMDGSNVDTYIASGITSPTEVVEFKLGDGATPTITGNSVVAIYPTIYGEEWLPTDVVSEEGHHSATVYYEPKQKAVAGSYDPKGPVLMAYNDNIEADQNLAFKNMSALLKFTIAADSDPVHKVSVFIPEDDMESLSGWIYIDEVDGDYEIYAASDPVRYVDLLEDVEAGRTIDAGKTYYLAVAPGTFSKLTFQMNGDVTQQLSINREVTLERNTIYDLGEFSYTTPDIGTGWALPGGYNNWDTSFGSTYLKAEGDYYVAKNVKVMEGNGSGFKFCHAEYGWKGVSSTEAVAVDTWHKLNGENNITLAENKAYDIYMSTDGKMFYVTAAGSKVPDAPVIEPDYWEIMGTMNSWAADDYRMTEQGDYLVYKGLSLKTTDEFKFRKNGDWNEGQKIANISPAQKNTEYDLTDSGAANMKIAVAGTYDVYMTKDITKVYFMESGKTPSQAGQAETVEVHVYCKTTFTNLWAWLPDHGDFNLTGGSWPGYESSTVNHTVDGETYTQKWTLTVSPDHIGQNVMVIFSGAGKQTADSGPYKLSANMYFTVDSNNNNTVSQK